MSKRFIRKIKMKLYKKSQITAKMIGIIFDIVLIIVLLVIGLAPIKAFSENLQIKQQHILQDSKITTILSQTSQGILANPFDILYEESTLAIKEGEIVSNIKSKQPVVGDKTQRIYPQKDYYAYNDYLNFDSQNEFQQKMIISKNNNNFKFTEPYDLETTDFECDYYKQMNTANSLSNVKIYIDAGHGGDDKGINNENSFTLSAAKQAYSWLGGNLGSNKISLTREEDTNLAQSVRDKFSGDLFISIHNNHGEKDKIIISNPLPENKKIACLMKSKFLNTEIIQEINPYLNNPSKISILLQITPSQNSGQLIGQVIEEYYATNY